MLDDRLLSEICRFFLSYQETLQHILHLKCRGLESFICGLEGAARSSAVTLNSSAQEATAGFEASHVKDQTPAACSLSGGPVEISQRGKSTLETLQFTTGIHLHFTEQFSFFSKRMRPQLPLCWVSTPSVVLCFVFFFFQALRHWLVVFLTSHSTQEVCRLKTGPCHCFHSPPRTTELNLTPITRLQVPKILTSTHRGLILPLRAIYTEPR